MVTRKASYSVTELAKLLSWTRQKVWRWIKENGIRTVRVGKKKVEVPIAELYGENLSLIDSGEHLREDD